jgi:hypothetical protein
MKTMLLIKLKRTLAVVSAMAIMASVGAGIVSGSGVKALSEGQEPKTKTTGKVLSKEDKDELAARLWSLQHPHSHKVWSTDRYNLIGNLVENGWWRSQLPLSPAQADTIMKLDGLIRDASDNTGSMIADSLEKNPTGFRETLARFNERLHESIRRGQQVVSLGLLTESQAAYVLYSYTSDSNHLYVLRDPNIQELLGMTAAQNKELEKAADAATRREVQLNLWTVDPIEQEYVRTVMAANAKRMNAEALRVLTPAQRKIWDAFTAKRTLAAKAPEMPTPTKNDIEHIRISEKSAIFRMLAEKENTLKLTEAQKKLVNRLEEVAQTGLHWISLRKPESAAAVERVSKVSAEFIQHAEQLVLSCILTEQQAEQIKSAIAKADSGTKPKN